VGRGADRQSPAGRGSRRRGGALDEAGPPAAAGLDQPRLALDDQLAPLDFIPSWSLEDRVRAELEVLGLNVSAHPLHFVRDELKALRTTPFAELAAVPNGRRVRLAGVLERAQMPWIRSGHRTLFLTLEDETELAQVVVFNDIYLKYGRVLKESLYLYVEGELQNSEEHGLAVVAQRIDDLLRVVGRATARRAERRDGGARTTAAGLPPAAGPKRADAWELPGVQPQTRPGRTG
jgi:error-prone DNA polymerase